MNKFTILITITFVAFNSCSLFTDSCYQEYEFTFQCTFSPQKDTFHIGDTIEVSCFIPDNVFDSISQKEYTFGNHQHVLYFSVDVNKNPLVFNGEDNFELINLQGSLQLGSLGIDRIFSVVFSDTTGGKITRSKIIPRDTGLYYSNYNYLTDDYYSDNNSIINNNCTEFITLNFHTNGRNPDNNYEMAKTSFESVNTTKEESLDGGIYVFRVIE
jgi:hypothetical protein